jgi:hypothetical protein
MTPNQTGVTRLSGAERSLLKFIASSARPLKKDAAPTALAAFDTLQRTYKKYKDHWWILWIVCMDGYADITPAMPIQKAVEQIQAHGGAAGIVGLTVITRTFTFLKKPLKAGAKIHDLLDRSGNAAADRLLRLLEPVAAEAKFLREQIQDKSKHN